MAWLGGGCLLMASDVELMFPGWKLMTGNLSSSLESDTVSWGGGRDGQHGYSLSRETERVEQNAGNFSAVASLESCETDNLLAHKMLYPVHTQNTT